MGVNSEVVLNNNTERNPGKAFMAVIGIVFLLGFGFWIKQVMAGSSNFTTQYAWGLYIAAFFTAAAGGAGAMILASLAINMNLLAEEKIRKYYKAAVAMFVMAGFFIMADLGSPLNVFNLVFTTNVSAPMVWDFWLLAACVVVCLLMVFLNGQKKALSLIGLVSALGLLIVESWLIASSSVQELWGVTMGAGTAYIQVAVMAFALLMLIGQQGKYVRYGLSIALLLFLAVSLTDLVAGLSDGGRLGLQWAVVSKSAVFWTGIILGVIVPLSLLKAVKSSGSLNSLAAPVLAMLGVLFTKLSYIWSSQAVPAIDQLSSDKAGFHLEEVIIVLGFTALGIIVFYALNVRKGGA